MRSLVVGYVFSVLNELSFLVITVTVYVGRPWGGVEIGPKCRTLQCKQCLFTRW